MLKRLTLGNVGPASGMELMFGDRLNLLTGDNGLGKSFLLDIAWWALTRNWPAEVNPRLPAGVVARPQDGKEATISFAFTGVTGELGYESRFDRKLQAWVGRSGRPPIPGLVVYAQVDGGFAIWDPARNYWKTLEGVDVQDRPPAYVFSPREVWDGLKDSNGNFLCNGLIRDWASWQRGNGASFKRLKKVLKDLSPSSDEILVPGALVRISLDDARDIPTLKMPYGQEVPVVHASAGIRRVMALAYLLVWAWQEHVMACRLLGRQKKTHQIIFLVDEIEAHLHPKWQLRIIGSLLNLIELMGKGIGAHIQMLAATHSPLVMASVESLFDANRDAWFGLDFDENSRVVLTRRDFEPHGDVANWLTSDAFGLASARNPQVEALLSEASRLLNQPGVARDQVAAMSRRLAVALNPQDAFLFRWRAIADKKGLWG